MSKQPTLFDSERIDLRAALELTAQSLNAYGSAYDHWAIAFSGGKDSSATVAAVVYLIETGAVKPPKTLTIRVRLEKRRNEWLLRVATLDSRFAPKWSLAAAQPR